MHERMLQAFTTVLVSTILLPTSALAQAPAHIAATPDNRSVAAASMTRTTPLPVRRVSLYKNGVGFFEHTGSVTGNQQVTIDFTTAQLNDVLQTLSAIDLNGGHIAGAGYNSTTPFDQQLKSLPLALGEDPSATDFYQAIRGGRVEIHAGFAVFAGRILNVEVRTSPPSKNADGSDASPAIEKRYLMVISDSGAVRSFELTPATEVRLLDSELHQNIARYLQLLAATRSQGLRHLTLDANGTGTRELHVSYISEVPVWKSTYRILFTENAKSGADTTTATLQGWAVVDNTVGADWDNVQLSLIAGAPQSFIQPISQPYYTRRPEIPLPEDAQLTPQTHESGEGTGSGSGGGTGPGSTGGMGGGNGQVAGVAGMAGMGGVSAGGPTINSGEVNGLMSNQLIAPSKIPGDMSVVIHDGAPPVGYVGYEDSATASTNPNTSTTAFDDYFEYKLADPITIRKNESALVPIVQTKIEAQRVTLWSPSQPQALRALWIKNTSNFTLDHGSFSILDDGRFGGEGLLEVIHPNERRLLSYAADQAVRVTTENDHDTRRLEQVTIAKGIFTQRTQEVAEREYIVHNAAPDARHVILEYPFRNGWTLDSEVKPVETTSSSYRFDVHVAPTETARLLVRERHTIARRYELTSMDESQLDLLLRMDGGDTTQIRRLLAPIFDAKRKLAALEAQFNEKQSALDQIASDQKRLRDNLAALKGSADERALVRRYTDELNQQEDKLASLRRDQESLRQQRAAAEQELSSHIQSLQLSEHIA